jgi:hypothetical protein
VRELTIDDFRRYRGKEMMVEANGGRLQLRLAQVNELPASGRQGGSFRLEFHGPLQPILTQGTYAFHVGSERNGIFIVPLGLGTGGMRYEAIFY